MRGPKGERTSSNALGSLYEKRAKEFLISKGYEILEQNYRCKKGEIDLIARDGEYLCFVEVKYRSRMDFGGPLAAVDQKKKRRIIQAALYYLMEKGYSDGAACRFDVVGVVRDRTELIQNAFELEKGR